MTLAPARGRWKVERRNVFIPVAIPIFAAWGLCSQIQLLGDGFAAAQLSYAWGALALGVYMFWEHGGRQTGATGLYGLSIAVFTGWAGLYWHGQPALVSRGLVLATASGFWTTLGIYAIRSAAATARRPPEVTPAKASVTTWGMQVGAILTLGGAVGLKSGLEAATQFALAGAGLFTASLVQHHGDSRKVAMKLLVTAGLITIMAVAILSAFGRLMLVTLGLVSLIVASNIARGRRAKVIALTAVIPVFIALVEFREEAQRAKWGEASMDGLGSAVSPLDTLARILDADVSGANGGTFLTSLLFWIPRRYWEEKPLGLGSALTERLEPQLLKIGHSMAAQSVGEWYFNWRWLGVAAMVLAFATLFALLDRLLARRLQAGLQSRRDLLFLVAIVFLVAEVPVLAWSGSFTFVTRAVPKVAIMFVLMFICARADQRHLSRRS